jgi:hypothetical protein
MRLALTVSILSSCSYGTTRPALPPMPPSPPPLPLPITSLQTCDPSLPTLPPDASKADVLASWFRAVEQYQACAIASRRTAEQVRTNERAALDAYCSDARAAGLAPERCPMTRCELRSQC